MKKALFIFVILLFFVFPETIGQVTVSDSIKLKTSYPGGPFYQTGSVRHFRGSRKPKNIVLMIGDGMGLAQVFAGLTANGGHLFIDNFNRIGFSKTQPAKRYVTDSAAGGTAISTGVITFNGAIGVDTSKKPLENIFEVVRKKGKFTGVVVTKGVADATPASFVAHVPSRYNTEDIAAAYVNSGINLFIGSGRWGFENRKDGKDLISELTGKGYQVCTDINGIKSVKSGYVAGFLEDMPLDKRAGQLEVTTGEALRILGNNPRGFFLMVEGSEIDGGGHSNDIRQEIGEMLDFDQAIGKVLKFAENNRRTLVIVTADHETGGLSLTDGDMGTGKVTGRFATTDHTGIMVPVFAYGPGADTFAGIYENTGLFERFLKVLRIKRP